MCSSGYDPKRWYFGEIAEISFFPLFSLSTLPVSLCFPLLLFAESSVLWDLTVVHWGSAHTGSNFLGCRLKAQRLACGGWVFLCSGQMRAQFWSKGKGMGKGEISHLCWCLSKGKKKKDYTSRLKSKAKPQLCNFERFLNLYWLILKTLNFKEITKNFSWPHTTYIPLKIQFVRHISNGYSQETMPQWRPDTWNISTVCGSSSFFPPFSSHTG